MTYITLSRRGRTAAVGTWTACAATFRSCAPRTRRVCEGAERARWVPVRLQRWGV
jgi:hypothetical protein